MVGWKSGIILACVVLAIGAGFAKFSPQSLPVPKSRPASQPHLTGAVKSFVFLPIPQIAPIHYFEDVTGLAATFGEFKNRIVLVNIWASWCAPCREELRSLDRLQGVLGEAHFLVLPMSVDRDPGDAIAAFIEYNIRNLSPYFDRENLFGRYMGIDDLPLTVLMDGNNTILGYYRGATRWDSPEAEAMLAFYIEKLKAEWRQHLRRPVSE